jgi:hypothetical protein
MAGTTPRLSLSVVLDGSYTAAREDATWLDLSMGEIGAEGRERIDHTFLAPKIGWRLLSRHLWGELFHEQGIGATRSLLPSNGNALVAGDGTVGFVEVPTQRHLSELPDVPLGVQTATGDNYLRKRATTSMNIALSSDMTDLDAPSTDDPVPLDRSLVSNDAYDADDQFVFAFTIPGIGSRSIGPVARFYFPGLAGRSAADYRAGRYGLGVYSLTLSGDGFAQLHENLDDDTWAFRKSYYWCEPSRVVGFSHRVVIHSDALRDGDGNFVGRTILFNFTTPRSTGIGGAVEQAFSDAVRSTNGIATDGGIVYRVPGASYSLQPTTSTTKRKVRIDVRRDVRLAFRADIGDFFPTGVLQTQAFLLSSPPSSGTVRVTAFGHFPAGTSCAIAIYDSTGAACTMSGASSDLTYATAEYDVTPEDRSYYAVLTLNARSDGLRSPTIKRFTVYREPQTDLIVHTEVPLEKVELISTTDGGTDPSTESLGVSCRDITGAQNTRFLTQAGMPVQVRATGVDPEDPAAYSIISEGYVTRAKRTRLGGRGVQGRHGSPWRAAGTSYGRYAVQAVGEWSLLSKRLIPGRLDFSFARDLSALTTGQDQPYKITDAIRALLQAGHVTDARMDVPDLPLRLPLDIGLAVYLEKFSPVLPTILTLVRDYLGAYLTFDSNAGASGKWRVLFAPRPPYSPVARFWFEPQAAGHVASDPGAYPDGSEDIGTEEEPATRSYPATFFRAGTFHSWVEPPQYNQVIVRGTGELKPEASGSLLAIREGTGALECILRNFIAALFSTAQGTTGGPPSPDPTHRDYTNGHVSTLYHADPGLTTPEAVAFVARRLFDMKCHAKEWAVGEAPLVFVSPTVTGDSQQTRYRKLRFGDPVLFPDGSKWLVMSCNVLTEGKQQGNRRVHAYYEFMKAPDVDTYAALYGSTPPRTLIADPD